MEEFLRIFAMLGQPQELTDPSSFTDMLKDDDRNEKYFKAIKAAINEKRSEKTEVIVLDIGCGTGLLTMMALAAGADKVFACDIFQHMIECSKRVLQTNGFDLNKVIFLGKRSQDIRIGVDFPRKADILVTEIFDSELIGEGAISTINHARKHLLWKDAKIIPNKGRIFAQVVDCPMIRNLSIFNPIQIDENLEITFPPRIENCSNYSNGDHAIALNELNRNGFKKISPGLLIFEFDWSINGTEVPEDFDSSETSFLTVSDGEANTVFTWWELELGSFSGEPLQISTRPRWSGGQAPWRFHWENSAYYGFTPVHVFDGNTLVLKSFRNSTKPWFAITKNPPSGLKSTKMERPLACICFSHEVVRPWHFGLQNECDHWIEIIRQQGKNTIVCLSDNAISLPLIAAGLGAKVVYMFGKNRIFERVGAVDLVRTIASENNLGTEIVDGTSTRMTKISLVIGEPFYRSGAGVPTIVGSPWDSLSFWKQFHQIPRNRFAKGYKVIPGNVIIYGIALNFDNMSRPFTPVGRVRAGDETFDFADFDDMIVTPFLRSTDPYFPVKYLHLWQYPSTASCRPLPLFTIDITSSPRQMRSIQLMNLDNSANGFAFWCEWDYGTVKSSGLLNPSLTAGERPTWHKYLPQAVIFQEKTWTGRVLITAEIDGSHDNCELKFKLVNQDM